jgi:Holliday junction resolvase RusA-like endonuclease
MAISFSLPGDPVPQPRPRVSTVGGYGRAYVPKAHPVHAYRAGLAAAAKRAGCTPASEPVGVVIDLVFGRPKSHLRRGEVKATAPRLPRADVDNAAKAVLDALTGIAWHDDAQVARLVVEKSYSTEGRTTVRIGHA